MKKLALVSSIAVAAALLGGCGDSAPESSLKKNAGKPGIAGGGGGGAAPPAAGTNAAGSKLGQTND